MNPEEPWAGWPEILAAVPFAHGCCCACNGSGLDGDRATCRDCHGIGINNHGE